MADKVPERLLEQAPYSPTPETAPERRWLVVQRSATADSRPTKAARSVLGMGRGDGQDEEDADIGTETVSKIEHANESKSAWGSRGDARAEEDKQDRSERD